MVRGLTRKIEKEVYDRAVQNRGFICDDDMNKVFTDSEIWGYGVYMPLVKEQDGEYWVTYNRGESCD